MSAEPIVYRAGQGSAEGVLDADPITTEVIRHGLNAAADRMKRALVRTSVSQVIYEVLDFAVAIYDEKIRLLSQAPSLPLFMGTLNFCVEAAVAGVGGEENLDPGDVILYNIPYGGGSHPPDVGIVMPVFFDDETLIGYTVVKAHWLDIGGKEPYSTDTIDLQQEGTLYPGVKLYRAGERVEDIYKMVIANTRVPKATAGDLNAAVVGVRAAADALIALVERHGLDEFRVSVERMFDHGEAVVRSYFEQIPDGRYVGNGQLDSDGVTDGPVPFEVVLEIEGSSVRVDYTLAPDQCAGPMNCPIGGTVSASRLAICALAGGGASPHEGHFRPIEVVARPGSMFNPVEPAPTFLYVWPAMHAIEAIFNAVSKVLPEKVTAGSAGCLCGLIWWGTREGTGEPWADGSPHPVGQGAHSAGDGANSLMHITEANTRFAPVEVWEAKNPWLLEKCELAADSGGAGRFRGGLGVDMYFRMLEDSYVTSIIERTKSPACGLERGLEGRANGGRVRMPDGSGIAIGKSTRTLVPKGATFELHTGGGGGYGPAAERDPAAVREDLVEGYITEAHAREHYPDAVAAGDPP